MKTLTSTDRVRLTGEVAAVCRRVLTRLGFCHRTAEGGLWEVRFADVAYYPSQDVAILTVDVHRLPRRVTTVALADAVVLHELSTAIGGYPVQALNTSGLTYVVRYAPPEHAATLPRCVDLDLTTRPTGQYLVPLGVDGKGPRWESLLRLLNVLIGGQPGGGKSMLLNAWLAALTQAHGPEELRLSLVDPKGVEMHGWRDLPHLCGAIAETPDEAEQVLDLVRDEIERRKRMFQGVGARNLAEYNQRMGERANQRARCCGIADSPFADSLIPLHLVVIDELTDLTIQAGGPKSSLFLELIRAASIGRALGILFIVATQSPRAEIINGNLKAALNTRIAFRTASRADSRVILDRSDAADIPANAPGRMVMMAGGKVCTFQSFFLGDDMLREAQGQRTAGQETEPANILTPDERRVLELAQDEFGGAFPVDRLYARLGPKSAGGVSLRWLKDLARRWEARGWLLADPSDPTQPRVLTGVPAGVPADVPTVLDREAGKTG
jgi:hypothetical protein